MLPVTVPFQGLKWPRHYLQITALCKAAPSGVICQWPQGRGETEGNRHKQASEKCNGFVKDLASGVTVEEYHSYIRQIRSSGELVNIKGLCKSLPCEDSWQEICLWPSKKEEEFMKSLLLHLKAIPAIKKRQLQFQVGEFTVVIKTVQLFNFYLTHKPDSSECCTNTIKKWLAAKTYRLSEEDVAKHFASKRARLDSQHFTSIDIDVRVRELLTDHIDQ